MKMKPFLLPLALALAFPALAAAAGWSGPGNLPQSPLFHKTAIMSVVPPAQRAAMPNITMADQHGIKRELSSYRGQVLVINFWATWCAPCIKEMPALETLQDRLGPGGLAVLPLSQDAGGADVVKTFYQRQKLKLTVLTDPDSQAFRSLGLRGLPTTIVVDRRGRVAASVEGPREWDSQEATAALKALLAER